LEMIRLALAPVARATSVISPGRERPAICRARSER
jgi:hypothetical protein